METQPLQRYIVTLKKGVDCDSFYHDMETVTDNIPFIPNRAVDIATWLPHSSRNTYYLLSDTEAWQLKNDTRVLDVVLSIEGDPKDLPVMHQIQTSNFKKSGDASKAGQGNYKNWGLLRCAFPTSVYGTTLSPSTSSYPYHLDGTGVDYVVCDSGIELTHPEFQDANGVNRVQQIDWWREAGEIGKQSSLFYRDIDGHGTHVASISAGKTFGWAKNARIYAMKIGFGQKDYEVGTTTFTGYSYITGLSLIRQWHENKPVDTITGKKRPTIVNCSWSMTSDGWPAATTDTVNLAEITRGTYRGVDWIKTRSDTVASINSSYHIRLTGLYAQATSSALDAEIDDLVDSGVHVCHSAGNDNLYAASPNDIAYNDSFLKKHDNATIDIVPNIPDGSTQIEVATTSAVKAGDKLVLIPMANPTSHLDYTHDTIYYTVVSVTNSTNTIIQISPVYYGYGVTRTGTTDRPSVMVATPVKKYYHRPGSPYSEKTITVGAVSYQAKSATLEASASFSNKGPFVNVWAPGNFITAAISNTHVHGTSYAYNENSNFRQISLSGTSQASPQVAGVIALYLQINPDATTEEVRNFIKNTSTKNVMYDAGALVYDVADSIQGADNKYLYFPYASDAGIGADVTLIGEEGRADNLKIAPIAYTYANWAADYQLSDAEKLLGINIANLLYLSKVKLGFQYPLTFHGTILNTSAKTNMTVRSDAAATNAGLAVGMVITKLSGTGAFGGGNTTTISSVSTTFSNSISIQSSADNTKGTVDFNITLDVYGLNRKPDAVSLEYWTRRCLKTNPAYINPGDTWTAGDYNSTVFKKAFCDAVLAGGPGADLTNFFFPLSYQGGYWTNGDFIDKGILP